MYILDTNTLIYFFKGMGKVSEKLLSLSPKEVGIPTAVLYELEVGIAISTSPEKRSTQLQELIGITQLLPFGFNEATAAANVRANLEASGNPIGPYDVLIAGTALAQQGILVTNNTNEFQRVPNLRIENWYQ
ncbi:MAG: type II toxin-antitoxin system VapC family toxin [Exilibacterium sp.]